MGKLDLMASFWDAIVVYRWCGYFSVQVGFRTNIGSLIFCGDRKHSKTCVSASLCTILRNDASVFWPPHYHYTLRDQTALLIGMKQVFF